LEEPSLGGSPYEGASSLPDTTLEEPEGVQQSPLHLQAPFNTALQTVVPKSSSREGSPLLSETLESSTLGSVTSDETVKISEFQRTLETARATAEKAAQLRQKERNVLQELSRVPLEDVPFRSDHILPEKDVSSGSASNLQSNELVNVSTPSTLSLSMTLPSELSVTATMSRTTQSGSSSRESDHAYPLISQIQSRFSDVSKTVSVTTAASFLTKISQNEFSRPLSSIPQQYSVLASGSETSTRTSSALPSTVLSSGIATEVPGRNSLTVASSSGSVPSRVSQPSVFQPSIARSGYSPGYVDYYYQKIEEERQLFEAQRNRIRRYSDLIYKKTALEGPEDQTSQASGSMRKNVPPTGPLVRTSPYISDQYDRVPLHLERNIEDTNKENQGYIANSTGFIGQDRLQDISKRLGAFEKVLTTGSYSTVVTSSYTSKPLRTSDWSHGSSTEYMSLPREAARVGATGSAGSTLSSLSELTEMMTRLTSTSDESDITSLKSRDISGAKEGLPSWGRRKHVVYGPEMAADAGFGSSVGHLSLIGLEGNINMRGSSRDKLYVPSSFVSSKANGAQDVAHACVPMRISTTSSGVVEPHLNASGSRWTRGSGGKQWFVLSRSHTLSSGGGILEKDSDIPGEVGTDNVFPDASEKIGPVSGREETGSVASVSSGSLSSGTVQSGISDDRLHESFATNVEPRGVEPSTILSVSNETQESSSTNSDLPEDNQ